jgi:hypothetical protein
MNVLRPLVPRPVLPRGRILHQEGGFGAHVDRFRPRFRARWDGCGVPLASEGSGSPGKTGVVASFVHKFALLNTCAAAGVEFYPKQSISQLSSSYYA